MIRFRKITEKKVTLRKYELLHSDSILAPDGKTPLYRIIAVRDVRRLRKGTLGGYIEKEDNLSHDGDAWVFQGGIVYGNARVDDNAFVSGSSILSGNARLCNDACMRINVKVTGNAVIKDKAVVMQQAQVGDDCVISGSSRITDKAIIRGHITCRDSTTISDNVIIEGYGLLCGDTCLYDNIRLNLNGSMLYHANICEMKNIIIAQGIGSNHDVITAYREKDGTTLLTQGSFWGSLELFEKVVNNTKTEKKFMEEYNSLFNIIRSHDFGFGDLVIARHKRYKERGYN